jgi:hypothetical protein
MLCYPVAWAALEHFHYYCDVVRLAKCGHSFIHPSTQRPRAGDPDFTPARKDRAGDPDSMEWPRLVQFLRLHQ